MLVGVWWYRAALEVDFRRGEKSGVETRLPNPLSEEESNESKKMVVDGARGQGCCGG